MTGAGLCTDTTGQARVAGELCFCEYPGSAPTLGNAVAGRRESMPLDVSPGSGLRGYWNVIRAPVSTLTTCRWSRHQFPGEWPPRPKIETICPGNRASCTCATHLLGVEWGRKMRLHLQAHLLHHQWHSTSVPEASDVHVPLTSMHRQSSLRIIHPAGQPARSPLHVTPGGNNSAAINVFQVRWRGTESSV